MLVTNRAISSSIVTGMYAVEFLALTSALKFLRSFLKATTQINISTLTFEGGWWFCDCFPSLGCHLHFEVLINWLRFQVPHIDFIELSPLDLLSVACVIVCSSRLTQHICYLFNRHVDPIFFEQSTDLSTVKCAATVLVKPFKHIIDYHIWFRFCTSSVVVRMRIFKGPGFEPLFEMFLLKLFLLDSQKVFDSLWWPFLLDYLWKLRNQPRVPVNCYGAIWLCRNRLVLRNRF